MVAEGGTPVRIPAPFSARRRLAAMTLIWAAFGVAVGMFLLPPRGLIPLVSGVLAGLIVLSPLGVALGLLGGEVKTSLIGGVAGVLVGGVTALVFATDLPWLACVAWSERPAPPCWRAWGSWSDWEDVCRGG